MRRNRRWSAIGLLALAPVLLVVLAACSSNEESTPTATVAAPAATAATAAATAVKAPAPLVIRVDTVWASKGMTDADKKLRSCVQTSRVKPGETVGWRIKVIDLGTGLALDDAALGAGAVTMTIGTLTPEVKFGPHGGTPPKDSFWSTWWTVPDTQATGILPWSITVKAKDGRTTTLKHSDTFNISSSWLTVMAK